MASVVDPTPSPPPLRLRSITTEDPWKWLAAGWRDMWRRPGISLTYGLVVVAVSYGLVALIAFLDLPYLFLPLAAAFMLVGPMLAVGLYEASRKYETNRSFGWREVAFVAAKSPIQLGYVGILLMLFLLVWVRIATLIFALFFGLGFPPLAELFQTLFFTIDGLAFLAVGTIAGALLAFAVFAISAISVPLLMDRDVDAVSAILASVRAVHQNFGAMMLWAWLIAIVTAVGLATLFVGLIVTFPLIGHATWHGYRSLVEPDPESS